VIGYRWSDSQKSVISLPRRSLARRRVFGGNAGFQSAGRIRRGEPELWGMAYQSASQPDSSCGEPADFADKMAAQRFLT